MAVHVEPRWPAARDHRTRRLDHEVDDDEIPGVVVSRVSASPKFMRELIDALEDNYSKWSTREGIKNLPEYKAQGPEEGEERRSSTT